MIHHVLLLREKESEESSDTFFSYFILFALSFNEGSPSSRDTSSFDSSIDSIPLLPPPVKGESLVPALQLISVLKMGITK